MELSATVASYRLYFKVVLSNCKINDVVRLINIGKLVSLYLLHAIVTIDVS